ncbi:MAG TPA: hypothetical protein VJT08_05760 [Terriglobales bacterium]|nr:hypothetical protein [Terriglobales bacterium]
MPYHARTALFRDTWSDFTATSHHFEEAFSYDAGASWHPNFIASLTRETGSKPQTNAGNERTPAQLQSSSAIGGADLQPSAKYRDGQHDFDFHIGTWTTHIKHLLHPLSGSTTWVDMSGTVVCREVWSGKASLEEIEANGPSNHFESLTLFLYNPQSHQWSLNFANSDDGTLSLPAIGEFHDGKGEFIDKEPYNGRMILVRIAGSDITPNSHRFEQAFSDDEGKTWETNFIAVKTRVSQ